MAVPETGDERHRRRVCRARYAGRSFIVAVMCR